MARSQQSGLWKRIRAAPATLGLRGWLAVGAALLAAGAVGSWVAHDIGLEAQLVRADPQAAARDPILFRFGAAQGRGLYRGHCASCHGGGGKGDRALGVPDLADGDWLYGTGQVSEIEKVATYGIRAHNPRSWNLAVMPGYARAAPSPSERVPPLTPGEIQAVTDYLLALAGRPADPRAARDGARVYGGKGGCYDCHTGDARGDPAIGAPNLTDRIWLYGDGGREAIAYSIAHGRQGMCPAWSGKLSPLRLREVSLYVFALSHRAPPPSAKAR
ncbi:MAG: c-type cytochrome [Phenylobacterium sp.]|nr:c-type cytochrome [Phenylobacterium sp.]